MAGFRDHRNLVFTVAASVWFGFGALAQAFVVNRDASRYDQLSYLEYAQRVHDTHGEAIGNRLQMPALPTFLSLFTHTGLSAEDFFARAKIVCIAIAAAVSALVIVVYQRSVPKEFSRLAMVAALVTAFFVFAFRGGYVQTEPLSYGALFVAFVVMVRAWRRESVVGCALVGVAFGLAFLTKATATVGIFIFVACVTLRGLVRKRIASFARAAIAGSAFFVTIYPYAKNSRRIYGGWLHNLSSHVVWTDSWEAYKVLDAKYDFNSNAPSLPPEVVPSFSNYWHSHTLAQMIAREARGVAEMIGNCILAPGLVWFALAYLTLFCVLLRKRPEFRRAVFSRDPNAAWWIVVPYLAFYAIAFGWYGPISANARFMLGLFAPGMFAVTIALAKAKHEDVAPFERWITRALVALLLFYYPYAALTHFSGG